MNILQAHRAAVLDRLKTDANLNLLEAGTVPKDEDLPYLVVHLRLWTPSGELEPDKVAKEATSDLLQVSAYCHSVGENIDASYIVAGRVRARLLGWEPVIAGRVCYPVKHDDNTPADPDETTGSEIVDYIDVYTFTSQPA